MLRIVSSVHSSTSPRPGACSHETNAGEINNLELHQTDSFKMMEIDEKAKKRVSTEKHMSYFV